MSKMERLITAKEVAAMLGVSADWVKKHVQAKTIPHIRLNPKGPGVRFRPQEIAAWCENRAVTPARRPQTLTRVK